MRELRWAVLLGVVAALAGCADFNEFFGLPGTEPCEDGCGANATCSDNRCVCDDGFEFGNDGECVQDACAALNCPQNASCNSDNTACACDEGYTANGAICVETAEVVGTGEACGDLTVFGECDGSTLAYCNTDNDERMELSCPTAYANLAAECVLVDDSHGYDCGSKVGNSCNASTGDDSVLVFCEGANAGCIDLGGDDGFTCVGGVGGCDEDSDLGTCRGDLLIRWCIPAGQPAGVDCSGYGGTCSAGKCVDLPLGQTCVEGVAECASPLVCTEGACAGENGATCGAGISDCPEGQECIDGSCIVSPLPTEGWIWYRKVSDDTYSTIDAHGDSHGVVGERSDGDFVVAGGFSDEMTLGNVTIHTPGVNNNPFIARFDSDGTALNLGSLAGVAGYASYHTAIDAGSSGTMWVAGQYRGNLQLGGLSDDAGGQQRIFIGKWDNNVVLDSVIIDYPDAADTSLMLTDMVVRSSSIVFTGVKSGPSPTQYVGQYAGGFVAAIDFSGNYLWHHELNFGSSTYPHFAVGSDGSNVYWAGRYAGTATILGESVTGTGSSDIFVAKLNSSGDLQWLYTAGGEGEDFPTTVAVTGSKVYVGGKFRTEFVADTDTQTMVRTGISGGFVVALSTSTGNPSWLWGIDGADGGAVHDLSAKSGLICVTGYYQGESVLDTVGLGSGKLLPSMGTTYSGYLVGLDASGGTDFAHLLLDNENVSNGVSVTATKDGGCAVYGYVGQTYDDEGIASDISSGGGYLMKYLP